MSLVGNTQEGNEENSSSKTNKVANKREKAKNFKLSNENENGSGKGSENDYGKEFHADDPCLKKYKDYGEKAKKKNRSVGMSVGEDPRFQQQNQTLRCFVSYIDFFRCEKILGEGHEACGWFKDAYNIFCPLKWIENFDEAREEGRFPWHRKDQGQFPGDKYG